MKKPLLFLTALFVSFCAVSQTQVNITTQQYDLLKQNKQLDNSKQYNFTDLAQTNQKAQPIQKSVERSPSAICSCLVPLDATFITAMAPNDDGSTGLISLPFTFNLYGTNYSSLYINNNGNVSFGTPYGTFSSAPFPSSGYVMVAPFWADVDTRGTGTVSYKLTPTALIVKWDSVGYYSTMTDKRNTFQLILTDGTDPILPAGMNASFCYGDMQWTTGAASGGTGGFGGTPSTVGVNDGTGISYFQVGRFDNPGFVFDGPYGANDSVDWLDNQGMYFDIATPGNIPPVIINNIICDTIDVFTGDTTFFSADAHTMTFVDSVQFTIGISTPESGQTVSGTFSCTSAPANFSYMLNKSTLTYKEYTCTFTATSLPVGIYPITITAADNGSPVMTKTKTVYIRNNYDASLTTGIDANDIANSISIYPNPANESILVKHKFASASVLTITNLVGQTIQSTVLGAQQESVDISRLNAGVYFATVTGKEGVSKTIKIIKK
jgi:hypothetical protein